MIDGSPLHTWHHKKLPIDINRRPCVHRDRMAYNFCDRGHYAIIRSSSDGRDRSQFFGNAWSLLVRPISITRTPDLHQDDHDRTAGGGLES